MSYKEKITEAMELIGQQKWKVIMTHESGPEVVQVEIKNILHIYFLTHLRTLMYFAQEIQRYNLYFRRAYLFYKLLLLLLYQINKRDLPKCNIANSIRWQKQDKFQPERNARRRMCGYS